MRTRCRLCGSPVAAEEMCGTCLAGMVETELMAACDDWRYSAEVVSTPAEMVAAVEKLRAAVDRAEWAYRIYGASKKEGL